MAGRSKNCREMRGAEAGERIGGCLTRPADAGDLVGDASNASRQSRRRDGGAGMVAGRAVNNEAAAVLAAHAREPGPARMRAALWAARHVNHQRTVEEANGCAA